MQKAPAKLGGVLTPSQSANIPAQIQMDLRSSNFTLGRPEDVAVYKTTTADVHKPLQISDVSSKGRAELKARMQKA